MTSHDCVTRIRKLVKMKKVGHTGTLDPDVTGVLPICLGRATKVAEYMTDYTKSYEAEVTLGTSTTTEDASGEVLEQKPLEEEIPYDQLQHVIHSMKGTVFQTPPMYSAVKIAGKKLYEYAREGLEVERPTRKVTIYDIDLLTKHSVSVQKPYFSIRVTCSKGTFIRTLAVDIGKKLGYPAHMSNLERIQSGPFTVADAITFEDIETALSKGDFSDYLHPLQKAVSHFQTLIVDHRTAKRVENGAVLPIQGENNESRWTMLNEKNELLAIYIPHPSRPGYMKPEKVIKT